MKFLQIKNNFLYFFTKKAVHNTNSTEPGTIPHCRLICYLLFIEKYKSSFFRRTTNPTPKTARKFAGAFEEQNADVSRDGMNIQVNFHFGMKNQLLEVQYS